MKGQYLAVESVLTVGMGLTLAIGVISIFDNYQTEIVESTQQKEAETVEYRLKSATYSLKNADSGRKRVELPEEIGGTSYSIAMGNEIQITTPETNYTTSIDNLEEYRKQGSVQGGTVTLYKSGNQFTLRSN